MKHWVNGAAACMAATLLVNNCAIAARQPPSASKVINLGSQTIIAFTLVGLPFRDVGLEARPGDALTPEFGYDFLDYELYWRLADGTVHMARIDLQTEVPDPFDGDVLLAIRDDHASVAWFNVNPEWIEYMRVGNPQVLAEPTSPYYLGCDGPPLHHPVTTKAWEASARRVRDGSDSGNAQKRIERGRCSLSWYIPQPEPGHTRKRLDEETTRKLRTEWRATINEMRAASGLPAIDP